MPKQEKKKDKTGYNPERRNGKAWKKGKYKPPKTRTSAKEFQYYATLTRRAQRKEENLARREEEKRHIEILRQHKADREAAEAAADALLIKEAQSMREAVNRLVSA